MNFLVIDSESKTVDFFRIFEAWNDFKSCFFVRTEDLLLV